MRQVWIILVYAAYVWAIIFAAERFGLMIALAVFAVPLVISLAYRHGLATANPKKYEQPNLLPTAIYCGALYLLGKRFGIGFAGAIIIVSLLILFVSLALLPDKPFSAAKKFYKNLTDRFN